MKNWLRYAFVATLLMAGMALPVFAEDTPVDDPAQVVAPTTSVYDDGTAVYYTRVALDGSVQRWVYDYSTDGTAQHVILLPESLYDPITDWGDAVEVDLDGDGVVDGTYYIKSNDIAPMAVVAKLKNTDLEDETLRYLVEMAKPGRTPGWVTGPNPRPRLRPRLPARASKSGSWNRWPSSTAIAPMRRASKRSRVTRCSSRIVTRTRTATSLRIPISFGRVTRPRIPPTATRSPIRRAARITPRITRVRAPAAAPQAPATTAAATNSPARTGPDNDDYLLLRGGVSDHGRIRRPALFFCVLNAP